MKKTGFKFNTFVVVSDDSVEAVIVERYPSLDTGDHRVIRTLSRYIRELNCSLALCSDGGFVLLHHSNGYIKRATIPQLIHLALDECHRRMNDASGYRAMCLEEDEEELLLLSKRHRDSSEAAKAHAAFNAMPVLPDDEQNDSDAGSLELPDELIHHAAELDIDAQDSDEEIYCAVYEAEANFNA